MRTLGLVLALLLLAGCKQLDEQLTGPWQLEGTSEAPEILTFDTDGTFTITRGGGQETAGQREVKNGLLCVIADNEPDIELCVPYDVQGDCFDFHREVYCRPGEPQ